MVLPLPPCLAWQEGTSHPTPSILSHSLWPSQAAPLGSAEAKAEMGFPAAPQQRGVGGPPGPCHPQRCATSWGQAREAPCREAAALAVTFGVTLSESLLQLGAGCASRTMGTGHCHAHPKEIADSSLTAELL